MCVCVCIRFYIRTWLCKSYLFEIVFLSNQCNSLFLFPPLSVLLSHLLAQSLTRTYRLHSPTFLETNKHTHTQSEPYWTNILVGGTKLTTSCRYSLSFSLNPMNKWRKKINIWNWGASISKKKKISNFWHVCSVYHENKTKTD